MCPTMYLLFHMMARDFASLGGVAKRGALDAYNANKLFYEDQPVLLEDTYAEYNKFLVNTDRVNAMRNAFARESGIAVAKQHDWEMTFMCAQPGDAAVIYTKFAETLGVIKPPPGALLVDSEPIDPVVSDLAPNNPSPLPPNCMMPGELAGHIATEHDDNVQKIAAIVAKRQVDDDAPYSPPDMSSRSSEAITSGLISSPVSHVSNEEPTPRSGDDADQVSHSQAVDVEFASNLTRNLLTLQREQHLVEWCLQNHPGVPPGLVLQHVPLRPSVTPYSDENLTPRHIIRDHAPPTPAEGGGGMNTYGKNGPTGLCLRADVSDPIILYGEALEAQYTKKLERALQLRLVKFGSEPRQCDRYRNKALFCTWAPWYFTKDKCYEPPCLWDALDISTPEEMIWLLSNHGDKSSNFFHAINGGIGHKPGYLSSISHYFERRLRIHPSFYDPWTSTDYHRQNKLIVMSPEDAQVAEDHRLLQALLPRGVFYEGAPEIADLQ